MPTGNRSMLSSNTHLQQGRYRIHERLGTISNDIVYHARDCLLETSVYIVETPLSLTRVLTASERDSRMRSLEQSFALTAMITNDRLIRNTDHFVEVDRFYVVARSEHEMSSPLTVTRRLFLDSEVAAEVRGAFSLIEDIRGRFAPNVNIEITPTTVRISDKGGFNLLFLGRHEASAIRMADNADITAAMSCAPLESIWPQLDSASKKAIGNLFDDAALDTLESPCDVRSEIYSIAAMIYRVATGQTPPSALERSIEMLDGRPDPLGRSTLIAAGYSDRLTDFFIRALSIRREDRFRTIETARAALAGIERVPAVLGPDEFDLLELPPAAATATPRMPSRRTDKPTAERSPTPSPTLPPVTVPATRREPSPLVADDLKVVMKPAEPTKPELDVLDSPVLFERRPGSEADEAPNNRSKFIPVAAVAALLVIVAGAVAFVFMGTSSGTPAQPQASIAVENRPAPEPAAVLPQPAATPEVVSAPVTTDTDRVEEPTPQNRSAKTVAADAKADKKPAAKADVKPEQKPKKTVTVDDLISDN
ncbi:MAG: hypothetical protein K1X36_14115 [Pyrinomonadaceae bacterium]|nr:hypothetical protein [Pyrinomonadaceae bacterium]